MLLLMCLLLLIQDQTLSENDEWTLPSKIKGGHRIEEAGESNIVESGIKHNGKEFEDSTDSGLERESAQSNPRQAFRYWLNFLKERLSERALDASNLTNLKKDFIHASLENGLYDRTDKGVSKGECDLKSWYSDAERKNLGDLVQLIANNKSRDYATKTLQDFFLSSRRRFDKANYYSHQSLKSAVRGSKNIYQKGYTPGPFSSVLSNPTISSITREPTFKAINRDIKNRNKFRKAIKKTKGKIPINSLRESGQILHESIQHIENEITVIPVTRVSGSKGKEDESDNYDNVLKLPLSLICQEFYKISGNGQNDDNSRGDKTDCDKVIKLSDNSNAIINLSELCKVMKSLSKSQKENNLPGKEVTSKTLPCFTEDADYDYLDDLGLTGGVKSGSLSTNKASVETTVKLTSTTSIKPADKTTSESKRTTTCGTSSLQTTTKSSTTSLTTCTSSTTPSTKISTIKICLTTKASEPTSETTKSTKNFSTTECSSQSTREITCSTKTTNIEATSSNGNESNLSTTSSTTSTSSTTQESEPTWRRKLVAVDWQKDKSTRTYQSNSEDSEATDSFDYDWPEWDAPKRKNKKQESLTHPNMTLILKDFIPRHLKRTTSLPESELKKYTLLIYKPHKSHTTPWSLQPASRTGVVIKNIKPIEKKYLSPQLKTRSPRMKKVSSTTKLDYDSVDDYDEDFDYNWKPTTMSLDGASTKLINYYKPKPRIILEPQFKEGKLTWQMGYTKFSRKRTRDPFKKSKFISKDLPEDLDSKGILIPENSQSNFKSNSVNNDCLEEKTHILIENESDDDYDAELESQSTESNAEEDTSEQWLIGDQQPNKNKVFWASMVPKDDTSVIVVYVVNQNVTSLPNEIELKLHQDIDV